MEMSDRMKHSQNYELIAALIGNAIIQWTLAYLNSGCVLIIEKFEAHTFYLQNSTHTLIKHTP